MIALCIRAQWLHSGETPADTIYVAVCACALCVVVNRNRQRERERERERERGERQTDRKIVSLC